VGQPAPGVNGAFFCGVRACPDLAEAPSEAEGAVEGARKARETWGTRAHVFETSEEGSIILSYFEIAATSVAPNWNRILPLRFDFKDCLNASLNWSSGYTCSTAAESDPSATRSPSFW
jgi:hypothetical protein